METSSYFLDRSQDVLEVLTTRMAWLENNEETPAELPSKDQQALKRDYDLLEFAINPQRTSKKQLRRRKEHARNFSEGSLLPTTGAR